MRIGNRAIALFALLVSLSLGSSAQAQYVLTGMSGGELQIGTGLPLPVGPAGIFLGGKAPATAGTFPPLLVPPYPQALLTMSIMQGLSTAQGGALTLPPGVLRKEIRTPPGPIAVFTTNPAVFQVRTTLSYSWPSVSAVFAPGGAPGIVGTTVVFAGTPLAGAGNNIAYSGSTKAFGGASQFALATGFAAGTFVMPPNALSVPPIATVWINYQGKLPGSATMALLAGASAPAGVAQQGASVAAPAGTTMWGMGGFALTYMGGPMGTVLASMPGAFGAAPSNMVFASKGYPWTTGLITLSQPSAGPAEIFYLSGTDMRVSGVGNISLVSGALSSRALSGPNGNRGWLSLTLPEPTAALGSAAALAVLGLCHGVVRRRSR